MQDHIEARHIEARHIVDHLTVDHHIKAREAQAHIRAQKNQILQVNYITTKQPIVMLKVSQ
jgi:hypothetical protein